MLYIMNFSRFQRDIDVWWWWISNMNRTAVYFDNLSTVQQFLEIFYKKIEEYENSMTQKLEENDRAEVDLRNMKNTANEIAQLFFTQWDLWLSWMNKRIKWATGDDEKLVKEIFL